MLLSGLAGEACTSSPNLTLYVDSRQEHSPWLTLDSSIELSNSARTLVHKRLLIALISDALKFAQPGLGCSQPVALVHLVVGSIVAMQGDLLIREVGAKT